MSRGRAVANRLGLAVTGLALLVLGGGALLRGAGAFGPEAAARPVVGGDLAEFAHDRPWFWPSLAAGGFLLAVAGLWWLVSRLRPGRVRRVRLRAGSGVVAVAGAPVARAVAARLCAHPRIRRARAVVRGPAHRPWLDLRLSACGGAGLRELLALVGDRAVPGLRAALAVDRLPAVVRLGFVRERRPLVRTWATSHDATRRSRGARAIHTAH
ncbi:hypothetical protein GCM10010106_07140 [Thermopolyspora flexuosa]|uniref:Uncharacterized protein n=1 Tax=Thermopolyspora flexuosa TaxID=103836 RepID=A0A543IZI7_9ACTN|nr:alkaline shock response membrane anchor protein AmaP [Thermopolyspora flexuosa]TQM75987.1 hypothetical protein FHX40_2711 [Thermopolyspora flexuosa]GGM63741.1 hypothetical protein GCM10010106_07140 [Thermopolyspora flexuosa]